MDAAALLGGVAGGVCPEGGAFPSARRAWFVGLVAQSLGQAGDAFVAEHAGGFGGGDEFVGVAGVVDGPVRAAGAAGASGSLFGGLPDGAAGPAQPGAAAGLHGDVV